MYLDMTQHERSVKMGKLIKINMYSDKKMLKKDYTNVDIEVLEENFMNYREWLKKNNKYDEVKNYDAFLNCNRCL